MKTVLLIRHAKSSWDDTNLSDFDRPLNERGKKDAPAMAQHLKAKGVKIDAFVSSPAKRAGKTCRVFSKVFKYDSDDIIYMDDLYHASNETYSSVIEKLDNNIKRVAIFSHNPGITDFANFLDTEVKLDNMPTCSAFAVKADVKDWKDFASAKKLFYLFEYPAALP